MIMVFDLGLHDYALLFRFVPDISGGKTNFICLNVGANVFGSLHY